MENKNTKRNIADTMEINSILEEARRNREQNFNIPDKKPAVTAPKKSVDSRDFDEDFVIYDERNERSNNRNNRNNAVPTAKKNKSKKPLVISIIAVLLVAALLCGGYVLYKQYGEFKYAENITVSGVKIGGMSYDDALDALKAEELKLADTIRIDVKAGDKTSTITKADIKYTFNTEDVLEQAKKYTEDTLVPTGEQTYTIAISIDNASCADAAKKVAKELDQPAKNALVTKFDSSKKGQDRFVIEEGEDGIAVKQTELVTQLHEFASNGNLKGTVDAQMEKTQPKYSKDYLLANIVKLSGFTTTSTNNSNGNTNMKISLQACNNSIINPGATWSFNKCTGDSNQTSLGYKPAGVLVNGRSETGIGGGICQSSTTIYNAAMLCGMGVVERACHYYPSTYVDPGRDATIDYGNIDLKLKNIFDYQLFMECYMKGVVLHCNIYGIPNPEFDNIKITSKYVSSNRAEAERTYYLDGKKVKTEALPSSTYSSGGGGSSNSGGSSNNNNNTTPTQKPTSGTNTKPSETPGTDTPGTDTPGTDTPGTDTPGTDTPGTDTPGTDTPGGDTPGGDTPGGDSSGGGTSGGDTSGGDSGAGGEQTVVEQTQ